MKRTAIIVALSATVAAVTITFIGQPPDKFSFSAHGEGQSNRANGPIIYYRHPDGKALYSASPKTTEDGRNFVAVLASEDVGLEPKDGANVKPMNTASAPKRVRYYRNPMGLPDTSPVPKKDSMGMAYIPVYEGDEEEGSVVRITPGRLQRTGVQSVAVTRRVITTAIRAAGIVDLDEHRQSVVALRFDAFIEKLEHATTGDVVHQGEPLMRLYSAALSSAAAEYISSLRIGDSVSVSGRNGSRQRLENLGLPDAIIKDIERSKGPIISVAWPSPRDGIVTEHNVVEGMRARAGDVLFRIADISVVWVLADVAERDLAMITAGQSATVKPRGYPGQVFTGKIELIYPMINKQTRTARVRIVLANPNNLLLPGMYTDVEIASGDEKQVLAVPENAVIDSGARKVVIIDKGEGRFEPREVSTGRTGSGYMEIREGVGDNEKVVTAANFLIDAESNLKSALQALSSQGEVK